MRWFRKKAPLLREYVSDLDRFLQEFDTRQEAYSASRVAEEINYVRIAELRDNPQAVKNSDIFEDW